MNTNSNVVSPRHLRGLFMVVATAAMVAVGGGSASAESASAESAGAESVAAIPECNVNTLSLSLGQQGPVGNWTFRALQFTNVSGTSCSMTGWPGVSYVAGDDGHQVGSAAVRQASSHGTIILAPGAVASAITAAFDIRQYDPSACQPTNVRGYRVYAPDDRLAMFVPLPAGTQACATADANFGVYAVKAGPGDLGNP